MKTYELFRKIIDTLEKKLEISSYCKDHNSKNYNKWIDVKVCVITSDLLYQVSPVLVTRSNKHVIEELEDIDPLGPGTAEADTLKDALIELLQLAEEYEPVRKCDSCGQKTKRKK